METEYIPKTAFNIHRMLWEYVRMPFGLKNAPATFHRPLDMILNGFKWQMRLVYIDDVIIYSRTAEKHIQDVDTILGILGSNGISLKLSKCMFFTYAVRYLGHIVRAGNLEVDQSHVRSFREARPPTTLKGLQSFLGFCNVYRSFVSGYTEKARLLFAGLEGVEKKFHRSPRNK